MKIDLTTLKGKLLEFAQSSDTNNNNYLDTDKEISLFITKTKKAFQNGEVTEDDISRIFGFEKIKQTSSPEYSDEEIKNAYLNILSDEDRTKVTNKTTDKTNSEFLEMAQNLDTMLIANEITGTGILLNRLPQYDLTKLADKYQKLEKKYNEVENQVENWYKNPESQPVETAKKKIFEENAQQILGMPYQEYASKYENELKEVALIPPIIRGVSSIAEIILHEQAVAKLSATGVQVYRAISNLNSALAMNFNSWENDIKYRVNDLTSEMSTDIIMQLGIVQNNEFSDTLSFEMPQNWLVKKNFVEAINETAGTVDINQIQKENKIQTKKILKDGKFIIEKTNPDGSKKYYDLNGKEIPANEI